MLTTLVNLLILLAMAFVVFLAVKYICDQAEVDATLRKIILLIIGIVFLVAIANLLTGHQMWGPMVQIP